MITYVICFHNGEIHSICRGEVPPGEMELALNTPEGGFFLDITGQAAFDEMDILEIHNGYQADAKRKKLVKRKKME